MFDDFWDPIPRPKSGDAGIYDRWSSYLNGSVWDKDASPFRISIKELIRQAEASVHWEESLGKLPKTPELTVTNFCKWIYSFYSPPPRLAQLEEGKKVEITVDTFFLRRNLNVYIERGWSVCYRDTFDNSIDSLKIDALRIKGSALYGKPDIVFKHEDSGDIIIVERKASQSTMPSDSWPNVRAQLWCYSKANVFLNAPNIMLVAEAWRQSKNGAIAPNGVVTWNSQDSDLNQSMQELFEIYRRRFH